MSEIGRSFEDRLPRAFFSGRLLSKGRPALAIGELANGLWPERVADAIGRDERGEGMKKQPLESLLEFLQADPSAVCRWEQGRLVVDPQWEGQRQALLAHFLQEQAQMQPYRSQVFYRLEKWGLVPDTDERGRPCTRTSVEHIGRRTVSERAMRDQVLHARESLAPGETLRLMHGSRRIGDIDAWLRAVDMKG